MALNMQGTNHERSRICGEFGTHMDTFLLSMYRGWKQLKHRLQISFSRYAKEYSKGGFSIYTSTSNRREVPVEMSCIIFYWVVFLCITDL